LARAYAALGVGQDDFVTIGLPNGIEFLEAVIATWKLGATPQPINARLPRYEREAIIALANPALVVGVDEAPVNGRRAVQAGFAPEASLSDAPLHGRVAASWKALTSGGSTGRLKLIVAGGPGMVDLGVPPRFQFTPDGCLLIPGPLHHNGPFSWASVGLFAGNHVVLVSRFDALETLALIERYRTDMVLLVPTMMQRIWRLTESERLAPNLSSLRVVWHTGAPCPPWLKQAWIDWLGPDRIWELYGGTEAQVFTVIGGTQWLGHPGSVGRPLAGEIRILDEKGQDAPRGTTGEVFLRRAPGTPPSYRYVGAEARAIGDWESLGDMGWMDGEGFLYLTDRQTDMILVGGANVYPAEIEAALDAHPRVRSSAVIGLPDEDLGQRIHAIVQVDGEVTDAELMAHLADRLASYKLPRTLERTVEPLRDDAGKVRRSALRTFRIGQMRYEVLTAADGEEALGLSAKWKVSVQSRSTRPTDGTFRTDTLRGGTLLDAFATPLAPSVARDTDPGIPGVGGREHHQLILDFARVYQFVDEH
jgi:bile acid-coenzyme A ligase